MNTLGICILVTAFVCLIIGLGLYVMLLKGKFSRDRFQTTNLFCWLLIALVPTLLICSFFPGSTASGKVLGISVTGAAGFFILIWLLGMRAAKQAIDADQQSNKLKALKDDLDLCLASAAAQKGDRPVPIPETQVHSFPLKKRKVKKIALITGNIQGVDCADIWVNSENDNMEMSRFHERSISGTIRYFGARRDVGGEVTDDLIMAELSKVMGGKRSVAAATVLATGPGELNRTNKVKKILHVASVRGEVGFGYRPIQNIELCVKNALAKADELKGEGEPCKTILFPLFGTGTAREGPQQVIPKLLTAAIEYLETHDDTSIETTYFLTWTDLDFKLCRNALKESDRVEMD